MDEYWRELVSEGLSVLRGSARRGKVGGTSVMATPLKEAAIREIGMRDI